MPAKRRAVVTGAASGIGLATALKLSQLGAEVVAVDLPGPRLDAAVASIAGAIPVPADLADEQVVHRLDEVLADADILVNNAGFGVLAPIHELSDGRWDEMLDVMLKAPFMLTRAALTGMVARGFGRIVNISSVYGQVGGPNRAAYVAAKHGILGLTKAAAAEAGASSHQVTVNAVCPGYVRTDALEKTVSRLAAERSVTEEQVIGELLHRNLVKRLIEPVEIAEVVAFLCREDMWAITGQAIAIDAGLLAT